MARSLFATYQCGKGLKHWTVYRSIARCLTKERTGEYEESTQVRPNSDSRVLARSKRVRVIPSRLPIRSPDSLRNWRGRVTDAGAFHRDAVDHCFQLDAVCVGTKASCLRERSLFGRRTICCCHGTECRWCGRLCLSTSAAQCFRNVRANRISGARVSCLHLAKRCSAIDCAVFLDYVRTSRSSRHC